MSSNYVSTNSVWTTSVSNICQLIQSTKYAHFLCTNSVHLIFCPLILSTTYVSTNYVNKHCQQIMSTYSVSITNSCQNNKSGNNVDNSTQHRADGPTTMRSISQNSHIMGSTPLQYNKQITAWTDHCIYGLWTTGNADVHKSVTLFNWIWWTQNRLHPFY